MIIKPKMPSKVEEKEKEPGEMTQKEFNAYYDHYKRTKLAEEKLELIDSLENAKQLYEEAVKDNKPLVASREKRGIEFLGKKLEANLKGTFTDPESAHQVILSHLQHDHAGFVKNLFMRVSLYKG